MKRTILKHTGIIIALLSSMAGAAHAISLQVSPVNLDIMAPQSATKLTLHNNGEAPSNTQIRVYRWSQENGVEHLDPTDEVAVSPPAAEIAPGQDYVLRVVRVTGAPLTREESYRLFVDELPEGSQKTHAVNIVVRHSVPVVFTPMGMSEANVKYTIEQGNKGAVLVATNTGDRKSRFLVNRIKYDGGKSVSLPSGGVGGTVLAHSTMSWPLKTKTIFRLGGNITLEGRANAGELNAQAFVQPKP